MYRARRADRSRRWRGEALHPVCRGAPPPAGRRGEPEEGARAAAGEDRHGERDDDRDEGLSRAVRACRGYRWQRQGEEGHEEAIGAHSETGRWYAIIRSWG